MGKFKSFQEVGMTLGEAWNNLEDEQKNDYRRRAKELRAPSKGDKYAVPFYTRCSPNQFMDVCSKLKGRKKIMHKLRNIGFDKLVNICCPQIQRDLCREFMRAFDPPTRTISIRGKTCVVEAKDVNKIMGLPCDGLEIKPTTNNDQTFKELKLVYGKVPYTTIAEWLVENKDNVDFEFLFVMYALGILLDPTSCVFVSDKVLKVMAFTKDGFHKYDWCSFVLNELANSIQEYHKELRKEEDGKTKNVAGCLYFLMIFCLQMFPLGRHKASQLGDAMSYWNEDEVQERTKLEKESKQGLLHAKRSDDGPTSKKFNPEVDLTHPLIKKTYTRLISMVGKELMALQLSLLGDAQVDGQEGGEDDEEEDADEGKDEDGHEGKEEGGHEGQHEGGDIGKENNDGGDEGKDEGGDGKGNEEQGHIQLRRSQRTTIPAIRSPYFVETKAKGGKKRKNEVDKEGLFQLCTRQCDEAESNQ